MSENNTLAINFGKYLAIADIILGGTKFNHGLSQPRLTFVGTIMKIHQGSKNPWYIVRKEFMDSSLSDIVAQFPSTGIPEHFTLEEQYVAHISFYQYSAKLYESRSK